MYEDRSPNDLRTSIEASSAIRVPKTRTLRLSQRADHSVSMGMSNH